MKGLPGRMGLMGLLIYDVPLLSASERAPNKGWIYPQRGVKQGCPLAPLLFVLEVDALAKCTQKACVHGLLKGYLTAIYQGAIPILQYADDATFFITSYMDESRNLSTFLALFLNFSGLQINRVKLVFLGFGQSCKEEMLYSAALGTPIGSLLMRYLGLALISG